MAMLLSWNKKRTSIPQIKKFWVKKKKKEKKWITCTDNVGGNTKFCMAATLGT